MFVIGFSGVKFWRKGLGGLVGSTWIISSLLPFLGAGAEAPRGNGWGFLLS